MKKINVSAPGKLMLLGEHAVVYKYPCIVTAVNQRMHVRVEKTKDTLIAVNAGQVGIKNYKKDIEDIGKGDIVKELKFIEIGLKNFKEKYGLPCGLKITTKSDFSSKFGFGSSSAVCVCLIYALGELFNLNLSKRKLFEICYKTVLDVQKVGSGFDVASAIWGGTIYYILGGKKIIPLKTKSVPIVVGYTGIKADTPTLVRVVEEKYKKNKKLITSIFSLIESLVIEARKRIENKNWERLGFLMNVNQGLLDSLGVGSVEISNLVYAARKAGAYGAKLSGAGGGDCIVALTNIKYRKKVEDEIKKAGGIILKVRTGENGVRTD